MSSMPTPEGDFCTSEDDWIWLVKDLWEAVRGLPTETVDISSLREVHDQESWISSAFIGDWDAVFHEDRVRIHKADLSYPVILHPNGWLMDGFHRVALAILKGETTVQAVRLTAETLPEPWGML